MTQFFKPKQRTSMKLALLSLAIAASVTSVSASALLVWGENRPMDDGQCKQAAKFLDTYTGANASHFELHPEAANAPWFGGLFDGGDGQAGYVNNNIKKQVPDYNCGIQVTSVPTVIWDLAFISHAFKSNFINDYQKIENLGYQKRSAFFTQQKFKVMQTLGKTVKKSERDAVNFSYKALMRGLLKDIKDAELPANGVGAWEELQKALGQELDGQSHLLEKELQLEEKAIANNEYLLFRATKGVNVPGKNMKALDSPVGHDSLSVDEKNVISVLADSAKTGTWSNRSKEVRKGAPLGRGLPSMNLSYSTSLLAGALFDGYNPPAGSCTFIYLKKCAEKMQGYSLAIPMKKLYSPTTRSLFHLPGATTNGVFGSGEGYHPRMRGAFPESVLIECARGVGYETITSDHIIFDEGTPQILTPGLEGEKAEETQPVLQFFREGLKRLSSAKPITDGAESLIKGQGEYSQIFDEALGVEETVHDSKPDSPKVDVADEEQVDYGTVLGVEETVHDSKPDSSNVDVADAAQDEDSIVIDFLETLLGFELDFFNVDVADGEQVDAQLSSVLGWAFNWVFSWF